LAGAISADGNDVSGESGTRSPDVQTGAVRGEGEGSSPVRGKRGQVARKIRCVSLLLAVSDGRVWCLR
jgi:hypothetical protein